MKVISLPPVDALMIAHGYRTRFDMPNAFTVGEIIGVAGVDRELTDAEYDNALLLSKRFPAIGHFQMDEDCARNKVLGLVRVIATDGYHVDIEPIVAWVGVDKYPEANGQREPGVWDW